MINKLDYWFLDVVLEMPIGINSIVPDRQGYLDVNRKPLDISFVKMAEILERLFNLGYLCASKPFGILGGSKPGNVVKFIPTKEEILQGLQIGSTPEIINNDDEIIEIYDNQFDFFLTPEGGQIWEFFSHPKWNIYFQKVTNFDKYETSIYCTNKKIVNRIIEVENLLDFDGLNTKPILDTLHLESISPLNMPYWKTFPSGYRATYKIDVSDLDSEEEDINNKSREFIDRRNKARKWYTNICNNWYVNYFKNH
jgi:hypothetical protein